jgi:type III secretion protein R
MKELPVPMFHVKHGVRFSATAKSFEPMFHVKQFLRRSPSSPLQGVVLTALTLAAPNAMALPTGADPAAGSVLWIYFLVAALPVLLIAATSFVKVVIVLSLLRSAIGVPQVPSNTAITTIGIVLSIFIMAPVAENVMTSVEPVVTSDSPPSTPREVWRIIDDPATGVTPFLERHSNPADIAALRDLGQELRANNPAATPPSGIILLAPSFLLSELKEAFIIGVILFLPFVLLDLVVVNILMSLGLHALNPNTISIPAKLLLFVVVDGWFLLLKGLILGYVA